LLEDLTLEHFNLYDYECWPKIEAELSN